MLRRVSDFAEASSRGCRTTLADSGFHLSILAHCVLFITMFGFTPLKAIALGSVNRPANYYRHRLYGPACHYIPFQRALARTALWNLECNSDRIRSQRPFTIAIAYSPSLGWLAATQALNGLAQGLYFPLLLGLAIQPFEPSKRATAMGFYQAVYSVGMFAGPFLAGFINESFGRDYGFWLGGVFAIIAVVLALIWKRSPNNTIH